MTEQLINSTVAPSGSADATLNGALDSSTGTAIVTTLPQNVTSASFRMRVDNEIMLVTAIGGTGNKTWTVTRGVEGTAAASHSSGANVYLVATAAGMGQWHGDRVTSGAYASRPAAGVAGAIYMATDTPIMSIDTGSAWTQYYGTYKLIDDGMPTTWVNQGTATYATALGGVYLEGPTGAPINLRCLVKTAPSTPYTVTALILNNSFQINYPQVGLIWRESGSGKIVSHGWHFTGSGPGQIRDVKWTNPTTYSADYLVSSAYVVPNTPLFLRITDNGTNRITYWSGDGVHWYTLHTVSRTDFLTADQVGIFVEVENATYQAGMWLLSWDES